MQATPPVTAENDGDADVRVWRGRAMPVESGAGLPGVRRRGAAGDDGTSSVRDAVSIAKAEGGRKGRIERDENERAETIPVTFTKPCVHCFHQTGVDGSVTRPVCHRCRSIEAALNPRRPNPVKVHPPPPVEKRNARLA